MLDLSEYLKIFIGLLAIINPIGAVPLFISMTHNFSQVETKSTCNRASLTVAVILLSALFLGDYILAVFAITIDSFRVGGGILILIMAISMLHASTSPIKQTEAEAHESIDKSAVAIVPLAMPLLAGPGAISTVILAAHKGDTIGHYLMLAVTLLVLTACLFAVLRTAPWLATKISTTGINVFSRIMGLILSAIAIEFIANGLRGLFPLLTATNG